ncbi:hypothetical protein BMW24_006215 [Mycobacterium heckeshornense]|uniref:Uncharacterized protein n=1 Tax=Mycobacterium heckeshornense TaxID=110505 RepID=A0A2G8BEW7_9MYCO|nr:hypothetical protein [Mycobacterium heckeshornense]KMV17364.1 hypothetical protein ACT16_21710 [Mycobacterium heckeshornense]MCV7037086.1 hypothetical protein [Mycobacterium heckeshornense]PIJ36285.1 hypothetical protein BMW24_006215 [Mycobacterium heckeshornense]BCO34115.1 hypothetical protein MHEC_05480 [Mycobacterium heckeshornense]BCQ07168.1 hypothetical protein JMUB5695_00584 [Mycobacterium heckeshornense]
MKALGIVAAVAVAFAPVSVLVATTDVAEAAPCVGAGANPNFCDECLFWVSEYRLPSPRSCYEEPSPRPARAPSSTATVPMPPVPPELPPPSMTAAQTPEVISPGPPPPSTVGVQGPKINPPASGAPRNAPLVTPPKGLEASPQAVAAAKAAPATRINFGTIHPMLQVVDFKQQVRNVINAHNGNVDVIKAGNETLARPRHWDFIDYDAYHRPSLYNPLDQAMTFRYSYQGAYREAYVPAGGRIVLDVATVGLFPFTAVGESYLASGSFYGGAWIPPDGWDGPPPPDYTPPPPPEVYHDVLADVSARDQIVKIGQVQLVGRDDSQPADSRDTFLLDDSTLAWGQINDPSSSAQIKVTKTQPLPGAGPTDDGGFLVALAGYEEPTRPSEPWWPSVLSYGGLALAVGLVAWLLSRAYAAQT